MVHKLISNSNMRDVSSHLVIGVELGVLLCLVTDVFLDNILKILHFNDVEST